MIFFKKKEEKEKKHIISIAVFLINSRRKAFTNNIIQKNN